jgi:hypothetical protein
MNKEMKEKLEKFHEYNEKARSHFIAYELKPGEPIHMHTEVDMMQYTKWRTKAEIELNEFHQILTINTPTKLVYTLGELKAQHSELLEKLERTEAWLKTHASGA